MKSFVERVAKPVVAFGATAAVVSGCEVEGKPVREVPVATETVYVTPDTTPLPLPEHPGLSEAGSILEQKPPDVNTANWCGFVAAREVIRLVVQDGGRGDIAGEHVGKHQSRVLIGKTSIGYTFSMEAHVGEPGELVVRGEMNVASDKSTPLTALDTAALRSDVRFNQSPPVAVWNLQENTGGTTNDEQTICDAAQDVVDKTGR